MRLRSHLFTLVAAAVTPMVALTIVLGAMLVERLHDTFRQGALARNRAFMSAIEAEVDGHVTTLQAIATSPALASGDLAGFRRELRNVLATQSGWRDALLADARGVTVVDSAGSAATLPSDPDPRTLEQALASDVPVLGNVVRWPRDGRFGVAVRLPLLRDGHREGVLTAVVDPSRFERLIVAQRMPAGHVSGITDRAGHIVARVPPRSPEDLASPDFRAAVAAAPEGWYRGRTIEGVDTYTAYLAMPGSGWSLGLATPADEIRSAALRAAAMIGLGVGATLALAVALAYLLSRRIAAPIGALAARARDPASRPPLSTDIPELAQLGRALDEGAAAVHERERLLEREHAALLEADRAKDEFLAMLGHELRNPLAAITSSTYLLRALPPNAPAHADALAILERQSRQMTRLIDDLLDVSRLTMGKVLLEPETFELGALAKAVVHTWERSGRVGPGRVAIDAERVHVHADRSRIEQVMANLLDNATKFSPPQTTIMIRVRAEGERAVLEVEDGGPGIAPEFLDRVFHRFAQAPQGLDRREGGLGLGLAVVRHVIELHGGSVDVANRPPRGACFTIRLPLAPAKANWEDTAPHAEDGEPLRVLVVEDSDDVRESLRAVLGAQGHRVQGVATGKEAIAAAAAEAPDVVLLDIGLPDMSGYEVARRLRHGLRAASHIVALTGYGQVADERRAREAGCDLHLCKPVDPADLLALLRKLGPRDGALEASAA